MRRLARHAHRAPDRGLARRDDVAVGARRLQRKGEVGPARHLADERDGAAVVHLLVADAEEVERPPAVKAGMVERLDGVEAAEQPRLHVAGARPQHLVALNRERARRRRADGEDGVGVAEQHHTHAPRPLAHGQQVVAQHRLAVAPAAKAEPFQPRLQPVLHGVDALRVVGARFERSQRAQVGQVTVLLRRQIGGQRKNCSWRYSIAAEVRGRVHRYCTPEAFETWFRRLFSLSLFLWRGVDLTRYGGVDRDSCQLCTVYLPCLRAGGTLPAIPPVPSAR